MPNRLSDTPRTRRHASPAWPDAVPGSGAAQAYAAPVGHLQTRAPRAEVRMQRDEAASARARRPASVAHGLADCLASGIRPAATLPRGAAS